VFDVDLSFFDVSKIGFAGRATPKSSSSNKCGSPESVKSRNMSGPHHNYPSETRSSGSGESTQSTPHGTTTQSRHNKTDRSNCSKSSNLIKNSVLNHATSSTTSQLQQPPQQQQHQHLIQKDSLSDDSSIEGVGDQRKPSFRQFTLHLDRISSLEDESFSSDLNHVSFSPSSI